ncbi:hypothetical protein ACEQ8H_008715 [Pleosporales sp. CAS-2024a]
MALEYVQLDKIRIPDYPDAVLHLDDAMLSVANVDTFTKDTDIADLTCAIGIATVLYNWTPVALAAFLDLDAWFSFTWSIAVRQNETNEVKFEIGRVGNQITFGALDKTGDTWSLMLTYNICMDGPNRGAWVPNSRESMRGDVNVVDPLEIDTLGRKFVKDLILEKTWAAAKNRKHDFFVEYAPMDVWGDGIRMNPHWLYKSLDLSRCTVCCKEAIPGCSLQRCGRCGTATYCSSECQHNDWNVHKSICNLSLEDRGQMLAITQEGGLIGWDRERLFTTKGSREQSKNPNFAIPQLKRSR